MHDAPIPIPSLHRETIMSSPTLKQANAIIEGVLAHGHEIKIKPLAVVVLDASGNIVAAQREDNASMFRLDIALGKAWGAAAMGCSSRALGNRAKDNPGFFLTLAATAKGRFLPQTGAILIRNTNGIILGSVGVSGGTGDEDEACCFKGIEVAGLTTDAA
jgi:uncharacterized protein GlcG (DUF336 family)